MRSGRKARSATCFQPSAVVSEDTRAIRGGWCGVVRADVLEACFVQECLVLVRSENRQLRGECRGALGDLRGACVGAGGEACVALEPGCPRIAVGDAVVEREERGARPEAAVDLAERPQPFLAGDEVQCEQAGGGVERAFGRVRHVSVVQRRTGGERPHRLAGGVEHRGGRVDAVERPFIVVLGEMGELETTARADH